MGVAFAPGGPRKVVAVAAVRAVPTVRSARRLVLGRRAFVSHGHDSQRPRASCGGRTDKMTEKKIIIGNNKNNKEDICTPQGYGRTKKSISL